MKQIIYVGNVRRDMSLFPPIAKERITTALTALSAGLDLSPKDFKYMPTVGTGCYELRLKIDKQYRVFYVAKFHEGIYILHAFVKKTAQTSKNDIDIGVTRYKALVAHRKEKRYDKKD